MPALCIPSAFLRIFRVSDCLADELRTGYRRYRYQSHYVFYTEEPDHIVIRAIIHTKQNLRPQLFR